MADLPSTADGSNPASQREGGTKRKAPDPKESAQRKAARQQEGLEHLKAQNDLDGTIVDMLNAGRLPRRLKTYARYLQEGYVCEPGQFDCGDDQVMKILNLFWRFGDLTKGGRKLSLNFTLPWIVVPDAALALIGDILKLIATDMVTSEKWNKRKACEFLKAPGVHLLHLLLLSNNQATTVREQLQKRDDESLVRDCIGWIEMYLCCNLNYNNDCDRIAWETIK